jgi:diguanylate cyclase (GGDEF)-like protein/PAS domain S-box-containing protein
MKKKMITTTKELKVVDGIINSAREVIIILDQDLRIVNVNRSFYKTFKLTDKETKGKIIYELDKCQWDIPKLRELFEKALPKNKTCNDYEIEQDSVATGKRVMLLNARYVQLAHKKEKLIILAVEDITEIRNAQNAFTKSNVFNKALLKINPFGIDIVDMQGTVLYINDLLKSIVGDAAIGKKCWETYADNKTQCLDCPLKKEMAVGETKSLEVSNVLGGKTFKIFHTCMIYQNKKAIMESFIDITDHKELEKLLLQAKEKLENIAEHDYLTGLSNRYQFEKIAKKNIAYATRHHKFLAVFALDIDKFKEINDSHGHEVGDLLLKEVGARLCKNVRTEDMVARAGGDEFVVLVMGLKNKTDAGIVAQKILFAIQQICQLNDLKIKTSISLGIACFPKDGKNIETLLKNADMALYKAKNKGGDNYKFYCHERNKGDIKS